MSDTIEINCPSCQQKLRVSSSFAGKQVRCPKCLTVFAASAGETSITAQPPPMPAQASLPPVNPFDEDDANEERYRRRSRRAQDEDDEDNYDDDRPIRRRKGYQGGGLMAAAICILIVAVLGLGINLFGAIWAVAGPPAAIDPNDPPFLQKFQEGSKGPFAAVIQATLAVLSLITVIGAIQMMRRKSWGLALAASIISCVNFGNCCCVLGLPFGIWGIILLSNQEVKDAFS